MPESIPAAPDTLWTTEYYGLAIAALLRGDRHVEEVLARPGVPVQEPLGDASSVAASHLGVVRTLARSDVAQAAAQHSRLAGCPVGRGDPRGSPASSWPARERSRRGHRPSMVSR